MATRWNRRRRRSTRLKSSILHRLTKYLGRWFPRAAVGLTAIAAIVGLLFLAEPYFEAPDHAHEPLVADIVYAGGIERVAMLDGTGHLRILENGRMVAVVRGHSHPITSAHFAGDGSSVETHDAAGNLRITQIAAIRHLSWPEREYFEFDGWGPAAWANTGRPALAAIEHAERWAECTSGLDPYCPGSEFRDCDACPEMVVVPSGSFIMGSPAGEAGRDGDETPQRRVTIGGAFAVGRFEVTFDEWAACVTDGGCQSTKEPGDASWGRGRRSVMNVSWNDVQEFIAWLNSKVEGSPYRLLTEAEWEYAARAGTTTAYFWGDQFDSSRANNNGSQTVLVGSYEPNAFGLYDMHGNVWEWVQDCYIDNYRDAPTDGSARVTSDCVSRVLRGGSWSSDPRYLRSANRGWISAADGPDGGGFRVARTLPLNP
ncbi:MAG: formylglycine-generating enzyme family protein [Pseudomonadota bacterium]